MLLEDLRAILARWSGEDLAAASISFQETTSRQFDANDDYQVVYKARFEPARLDRARIEIWATDTGHVAVGVETFGRVIQQLELRAMRSGFVGGNEPRNVSKDGLKRLLDTVSAGRIFIVVRSALWIALTAKIYMATTDRDDIMRDGYPWI